LVAAFIQQIMLGKNPRSSAAPGQKRMPPQQLTAAICKTPPKIIQQPESATSVRIITSYPTKIGDLHRTMSALDFVASDSYTKPECEPMPLPRRVLVAAASFCILWLTMAPAFAIVVQLNSASQIAFSSEYPQHAREKVRDALAGANSRFLDGVTNMRKTTLNFSGDATALNEMLLKLTECPAAVVSVSFRNLDHECDWRLVYTTDDHGFHAVVNLHSNQIDLEDLTIPPSNGPALTEPLVP